MRFSQLVRLFDEFNEANRRPRTRDFYRNSLRRLLAALGDMPAAAVKPFHVLQVRPTWHVIMSVQRLYRWAVEELELLATNPVARMKRPRLGARRRVLTRTEAARLLRGSRGDFRRFLLAARETAARPQELTALQWSELRWHGDESRLRGELTAGRAYFLLTDYKGRSRRSDPTAPRLIPISPRLGRSLWRAACRSKAAGLVFVTAAGKAWDRNSLRLRFRRLLARVKVERKAGGEALCCYHFRHTAATAWAAAGLQTSVVQSLLGHANIRTTQRYLHLARGQIVEAWAAFQGQSGRPARP